MGIRVLVVDDNPHVRWHGRVYPVNATFHRFLSAFLDLPGAPVASIAHAVPLRDLPDEAPQPVTLPVDPRIRTVATAPFDGIAGYLRGAPGILRANRPVLAAAVREADLVWIKVPASNAALAAAIAVRFGVSRFTWVAGSARAVAAARFTGPSRLARALVGAGYDAIGRVAGLGGLRVVVGEGLIDGDGVVASLLELGEIRAVDGPWPREPGRLQLVWAGRLAEGKGLERLLDALALGPPTTQLAVVGDGPAREVLAARSARLGVAGRVTWQGYVAERASYLDRLAAADVFVFPSPAEGFPKVILDAMAVGLPVVASPTGQMAPLGEAGLIEPAAIGDPSAIARTVDALLVESVRTQQMRRRAFKFAAAHNRPAEAARLIERWRRRFPGLGWAAPG